MVEGQFVDVVSLRSLRRGCQEIVTVKRLAQECRVMYMAPKAYELRTIDYTCQSLGKFGQVIPAEVPKKGANATKEAKLET